MQRMKYVLMHDLQKALESTEGSSRGTGQLVFVPDKQVANYMKKQIFENIFKIYEYLKLVTVVLTSDIDADTLAKSLPGFEGTFKTESSEMKIMQRSDIQTEKQSEGDLGFSQDHKKLTRRIIERLGAALSQSVLEKTSMEYHFTKPEACSPTRTLPMREGEEELTTAIMRPDSPFLKIAVRFRSQNVLLSLQADVEGMKSDLSKLSKACQHRHITYSQEQSYTSKLL